MAYKNPEPTFEDIETEIFHDKKDDYKKVDKVYFAFIDVLGFKKTFDDIRISQKEFEAEKYKDVFNYFFELMNGAKFMERGSESGCYAGQTSDSLYFYTEREDYLIQFMKIFTHFNLYAMSKNVFFRGGIAKGNLYKKKNYQFYGNSVIYAYLLESVISRNPIIVIDEDTNSDMEKYEEYKALMDKKNGRHYIKPFTFLNPEADLELEGVSIRSIYQDEIVKNIEGNKRAFEYDAKNYEKYKFLIDEFQENKEVKKRVE